MRCNPSRRSKWLGWSGRCILLVGALCLAVPSEVSAAIDCDAAYTATWDGTESSDWSDPDNWQLSSGSGWYPGNGSHEDCAVVVPSDATTQNDCQLNVDATIRCLEIAANGSMEVLADNTVTVDFQGSAQAGDGLLDCYGTLTINGTRTDGEDEGRVVLDIGANDNDTTGIRFGSAGLIEFDGPANPEKLGTLHLDTTSFTSVLMSVSAGVGGEGTIDGSPRKGKITGDVPARMQIKEDVTLTGDLDIEATLDLYGGVVVAETDDAITLSGNTKYAADTTPPGVWKADGGYLTVAVEVQGHADWEITENDGKIIIACACSTLSGDLLLSGGTFDVNQNWTTTGVATIDAVCCPGAKIDVYTGKIASVGKLVVGNPIYGGVTVAKWGNGEFRANE